MDVEEVQLEMIVQYLSQQRLEIVVVLEEQDILAAVEGESEILAAVAAAVEDLDMLFPELL